MEKREGRREGRMRGENGKKRREGKGKKSKKVIEKGKIGEGRKSIEDVKRSNERRS